MKRLLFLCMVSISCSGNPTQVSNGNANDYNLTTKNESSLNAIEGIQEKISDAFVQSFMLRNDEKLTLLSKELERLYKEKPQNLILYWRAYLQFYYSIYLVQAGDKKNAEKVIDKGIEWLKGMQNKNSEDYALLSMLQGFALQFKGLKVMFISGEVKSNARKAIAIDSTNMRAYYVYASNDFYTPEQYGGGKEAEKFLLKSLSLPTQQIPNNYLPSWGRQEAYELLIRLYIKNEDWDNSKKYFQKAIAEFPNNYQISKLAPKLVGK